MDSLIFFDKEGNSLNFNYNDDLEKFEGDILFHQNSSDTFKTQTIYTFERIQPFEFEDIDNLTLRKFQLFNEYGFHFYQGTSTYSVSKIEPVNYEIDYYSKWIYGKNFESKFKKGTFLRFNSNIFEFSNPNQLYVVVGSKKGAVMILSLTDNSTFESLYGGFYGLTSSYDGLTITGVDTIGIYNYIGSDLSNTLSSWNEYDFYDRLYQYRKLNVVNSYDNDQYRDTKKYEDSVPLTIKNENIYDAIHYEYVVNEIDVDQTLFLEIITKTDLPRVYKGPLDFDSPGILNFGDPIPTILKPGVEFKVTNSTLNNNYFLTVADIPKFSGNVNLIRYATGSQVIWDNRIYECIQAYTWSGGTNSISPTGTTTSELYWSNPTYLPINEEVFEETLSSGDLYLTTDHFYFDQAFTQSSDVTLASFAEKYKSDLSIFDVDLYFSDGKLKADLVYPTRYLIANFYQGEISPSYSIGSYEQIYEKIVEVYERVNKEFNYDYSENFSYNIVFTDIDEFGIIIKINKMVYQERISWVYSSGIVDIQRTIDKTLRSWLTRNFSRLLTLGILPTLTTIGYSSVYYNSINIKTEFPNVPLEFSVEVGSTADYYIEHTIVNFIEIGKYLSIMINRRSYNISFDTDIPTTLNNWIDEYQEVLENFGIFVSAAASALKLNTKKQIQRVDLQINVGKSSLPGIDLFKINKKYSGNHGTLITSNEILLGTSSVSFEEEGFSTGQVIGINSTIYPLQNVEFNSLYLNPDTINLGYEGPFWGITNSICNTSAFTTVAFTIGFGQTGCPPAFVPDLLAGMYDLQAFDSSFSIEYLNTNTYSISTYSGDISGIVDLVYVQPVNSIYVLGDTIGIYNSITSQFEDEILISGLTNSMSILFNSFTNYVYALSSNVIYKLDPYLNSIVSTFSLSGNAAFMSINTNNGDVYVSYLNANLIDVIDSSDSFTNITSSQNTLDMVFNEFENAMYVIEDFGSLIKINGSTRIIQSTYSVPGLIGPMTYDPENESIYFYGTSNLYKLDNGDIFTMSVTNGSFNSNIFNNLTSDLIISSDSNLSSLDVDTDQISWSGSIAGYGYLGLNQFDGDIYITDQISNQVFVADSNGDGGSSPYVKDTIPLSGSVGTKIIYNPDRRSMWLIQPSIGSVVEISVSINSNLTVTPVSTTASNEIFYGSLSPDYLNKDYLWLNVREYIRRPRYNFNGGATVSFYWKWFSDNVPQFFLYDFSGEQLSDSGLFAYTGDKPLKTAILNKNANRDLSKVSDPSYQQTIFDKISYELEFIDDNFDVDVTPEPLQLFVGYNSTDEGALRSVLQLYKSENIDFTIIPSDSDILTINNVYDDDGTKYGIIEVSESSSYYFNNTGLRSGQQLAIFVKDITNVKNQYLSENNGYLVKIRSVFSKSIIVDYFKEVDMFFSESNVIYNYPKNGLKTNLSFRFKVWDSEIGRFNVYGQTEIEDERFKIELNNTGKLVSSDDVYIFKEYDIKEEGIDWTYLNAKRKEMMMMRNLIYPYIGSYKSIINAINYFGYNDLELNEYYRNVDISSPDYFKLFKVEIPDIFDNTVEGWTENDYIKHTFPNPKFQDTNLFNLTYRITDKEGNNVLSYTLEEVQKKLQGLKYWLQKNIIPITHKILDITGSADFIGGTTIVHQVRDLQLFNISQDFTPISFDLNEAYLMPVNSGSSVYNCVLDFTIATSSLIPDQYTIDIRTYEIYREWYAFKNYTVGDRIIYYNKAYESTIVNNKTNNPRKFENASEWIYGTTYNVSDIVKYNRGVYIYTSQGNETATYSVISPFIDSDNWLDITEWKEINLSPIEKITENRNSSNLNPFNFTIDSNISPYLVIEVTSHNGYGMVYSDRKNYEIRGILDIQELEAFSNLTTKQYRDSTIPVVYVDVNKVPDLSLYSYPFTSGFFDQDGYRTDRPYMYGDDIVYPHIKHGFPFVIENNSSDINVSQFALQLTGGFLNMINSYVISSTGSAYIDGNILRWSGSLPVGATVSVEVRADVTVGGKSYWMDNTNTINNQALVPLTYSVNASLQTGQQFGMTTSIQGNLTPSYRRIYIGNEITTPPYSMTQSILGAAIDGTYSVWTLPRQYSIGTMSHYNVDFITTSNSVIYGGSFADVVEGFNNDIGDFGYAYSFVRNTPTNWFLTYQISTYYSDLSVASFTSSVNMYNNYPVGNTSSSIDSSPSPFGGFPSVGFGSGGSTVSLVYYP